METDTNIAAICPNHYRTGVFNRPAKWFISKIVKIGLNIFHEDQEGHT